MGPVEFIRSKLDIYRLEQRYAKGRDRRSNFSSGARYIDGEYIYENDPRYNTAKTSTPKTRRQSAFITPSRIIPTRTRTDPLPTTVRTQFGNSTSITSPAALSPATTSDSHSPSSTGSSPSRPRRVERDVSGLSNSTLSSRWVDHESYTTKGSGLGLGPQPFSGDADSAWGRLPDESDSSKRQSFMRRGVSWMND